MFAASRTARQEPSSLAGAWGRRNRASGRFRPRPGDSFAAASSYSLAPSSIVSLPPSHPPSTLSTFNSTFVRHHVHEPFVAHIPLHVRDTFHDSLCPRVSAIVTRCAPNTAPLCLQPLSHGHTHLTTTLTKSTRTPRASLTHSTTTSPSTCPPSSIPASTTFSRLGASPTVVAAAVVALMLRAPLHPALSVVSASRPSPPNSPSLHQLDRLSQRPPARSS